MAEGEVSEGGVGPLNPLNLTSSLPSWYHTGRLISGKQLLFKKWSPRFIKHLLSAYCGPKPAGLRVRTAETLFWSRGTHASLGMATAKPQL